MILVSAADVTDLGKRFEEVTAYASVDVASLEPHKRNLIIRAKRLLNKYGKSVGFTVRSSDTSSVQVFLPQRYSDVVTEADNQCINSVFRSSAQGGMCESSKAYILAVEPSP